jgi:hypothetical protein
MIFKAHRAKTRPKIRIWSGDLKRKTHKTGTPTSHSGCTRTQRDPKAEKSRKTTTSAPNHHPKRTHKECRPIRLSKSAFGGQLTRTEGSSLDLVRLAEGFFGCGAHSLAATHSARSAAESARRQSVELEGPNGSAHRPTIRPMRRRRRSEFHSLLRSSSDGFCQSTACSAPLPSHFFTCQRRETRRFKSRILDSLPSIAPHSIYGIAPFIIFTLCALASSI